MSSVHQKNHLGDVIGEGNLKWGDISSISSIAHAQKNSNPINILRKHFGLAVLKYVMEILMYCHLLQQPYYRCHRHETIGTWAETENWFDDRCLLFIDHRHPFEVGLRF